MILSRMKNDANHQLGSNPAQRRSEKTAREEVMRKRQAITSWVLVRRTRIINPTFNYEAKLVIMRMIT